MKKAPYSLSEALRICNEYQYLVGHPFEKNGEVSVNCVAVSPFDQNNKKRFIIYYLLFNDAEMALSHEYKGLLFDVMVIAGSEDQQELFHEDIHTWLGKNKPSFEQNSEVMIHNSVVSANTALL